MPFLHVIKRKLFFFYRLTLLCNASTDHTVTLHGRPGNFHTFLRKKVFMQLKKRLRFYLTLMSTPPIVMVLYKDEPFNKLVIRRSVFIYAAH